MARVDIVMPVRNGERFLQDALDSLQCQTFSDWRLLALDHASTDSTPAILARAASLDSRVQVFDVSMKRSLSDVLNFGLANADCEFLLRQDADDLSRPHRIETLVKAFETDPEVAFLGSHGDVIDETGAKIGEMDVPLGRDAVRAVCLFGGIACHPSVGFRLSALHDLGARYGSSFVGSDAGDSSFVVPGLAEDYFLFGQIALLRPCRNLPDNLFQYRQHGTNFSRVKVGDTVRAAAKASLRLAKAFSDIHGSAPLDPLPFANHSDMLLDIVGRFDFSDEFARIAAALRKAYGSSTCLERELSFRGCLQDRRGLPMGVRFAAHVLRHNARSSERNTVKTWLLRNVRHYPIEQVREPAAEFLN